MTDMQIMYGFFQIAGNRLEKTPDFWNVIIPMVKEQMAGLDQHTPGAMILGIESAAMMQLQDNEFWETVDTKLVEEQLYKFLDLEQMTTLINSLARVNRGSDELIDLVEKVFIKHRKGLTQPQRDLISDGFNKINKGSEVLHRVLADPTMELPALE